jgi:hypothetical protein
MKQQRVWTENELINFEMSISFTVCGPYLQNKYINISNKKKTCILIKETMMMMMMFCKHRFYNN